MRARSIMTRDPACCTPNDSAADVARVMREQDCGCIPVIDQTTAKLLGVVTDRDLAIRGLAAGKHGETPIRDVMTYGARCCREDDDLSKVERLMVDNQIRRIPVVDEAGACIGIISQADIARAAMNNRHVTEHEIAIVVERISDQNRRTVDQGGERVLARGH